MKRLADKYMSDMDKRMDLMKTATAIYVSPVFSVQGLGGTSRERAAVNAAQNLIDEVDSRYLIESEGL